MLYYYGMMGSMFPELQKQKSIMDKRLAYHQNMPMMQLNALFTEYKSDEIIFNLVLPPH
jgi:hypothetical protein